ncbi:related to RCC1 domain [Cephalotrichum gorgonifer]|uniref:Related to RCC1 domain n=1 Tax=Cephalotrichum gorgonifer TaxID=2041049 RepID=A0AAE8SUK8_9PEZI|nr:related to RCC1 domain [Cephalotrichum gorgonifer]
MNPQSPQSTSPAPAEALDEEPAAATTTTPRRRKRPNVRPTTKLNVFITGGSDPRDLGLSSKPPRYPNAEGGTRRPVLNKLLAADKVGVVQVSAGQKHAAALTHDGEVLTWGCNDFFALGRVTATEDDEATPTVVRGLEALDIVQVVATNHATFVLTTSGLVFGWGTFMGDDGIIGFTKEIIEKKTKARPEELAARTPTPVHGLRDITHLAAGSNHVLALTRGGNVFAWGAGHQGELGRRLVYRHRYESLTPRSVSFPRNAIARIFAGFSHSFAVDRQGRVFAWGLNNFGQTGIPAEGDEERPANPHVNHPERVQSLEGIKVECIAAGLHHSAACTEDGRVMVWGRCDADQVGASLKLVPDELLLRDDRGMPRMVVVPIQIPSLEASTVAAGTDNCFAINRDGVLLAWGFSDNFRTGLKKEDSANEPKLVTSGALADVKCTSVISRGSFTVFTVLAE